jgi:hypothetical protein
MYVERLFPLALIVILTTGAFSANLLSRTHIDYTDRSADFSDAPFSQAEAVAISVLKNLDVVQGNPDGMFHPDRRLNRAEFVKVAMLSHPSANQEMVWGPISCFTDVLHSDWFSPYVCAAKEQDIVEGFGDGYFKPGLAVRYAEAVKILIELYGIDVPYHASGIWHAPYMQVANELNLLVPNINQPDIFLTRGQMARLVTAFRVAAEGELELYRDLERGVVPKPEEESDDEVVPEPLDSNDDSLQQAPQEVEHPAPKSRASKSSLLMIGGRTPPIADGVFESKNEDAWIAIVEVILDRELKSIKNLIVLDSEGNDFPSFPLRKYASDTSNRTWRLEYERDNTFVFPAGTDVHLSVIADLYERGDRGIAGELFEVREFNITAQGRDTLKTLELFPKDFHHPFHRTVENRLIRVSNTLSQEGELRFGVHKLLAAFVFEGEVPPKTNLAIKELSLDVKSAGVQLQNISLEVDDNNDMSPCFLEGLHDEKISCFNLPRSIGELKDGRRRMYIYGDILRKDNRDNPFVQVIVGNPGSIDRAGAIRWTDYVNRYRWVEADNPLAEGTLWTQ